MKSGSEAQVFVQLADGREIHAGTINETVLPPRHKPVMTFGYSDAYLADDLAYDLSADLPRDNDVHFPAVHLKTFFAFRDVQPDAWGTRMMQSSERRTAREEGWSPKRLSELDVLLRIADDKSLRQPHCSIPSIRMRPGENFSRASPLRCW